MVDRVSFAEFDEMGTDMRSFGTSFGSLMSSTGPPRCLDLDGLKRLVRRCATRSPPRSSFDAQPGR